MKFVIIGNGIAGISAAQAIRTSRPEALITILSEERHPAYSACVLPDYLSGEMDRKRVFIKPLSHYDRDKIRLVTDRRVDSLDIRGKEIITGSESIPYDKLIIATGSKAAVPPVSGLDKQGVFRLKSLDDADRISGWNGRTAVVVGSGAVGVEAAIALKSKGYLVFLLELFDRILPQAFDEYPANMIEEILEAGEIEVSTGEKVVEVLGKESVKGVLTNKRKIPCDTIIMATGMSPDVRMTVEKIESGQLGGIVVDHGMRTSVPDIYACGDCVETKSLLTGRPSLNMFWHNAREQGSIAGFNAAGEERRYPGSTNISSIDLFGVQAVSLGKCSHDVTDGLEVMEREKNRRYQRLILANGILVGAQSINRSENMGALLAAATRKEKMSGFEAMGKWGRLLYTTLRCTPLGRRASFG